MNNIVFRDLNSIIRQAYRKDDPVFVLTKIKSYLAENKMDYSKDIKKIEKLIQKNITDQAIENRYNFGKKAVAQIGKDYSKIQGKINDKILRQIQLGLLHGEGVNNLTRRIKRVEKIEKHYANTIATTARITASRMDAINNALSQGMTLFEYRGRIEGARPWCKEHVGQQHTIEEWSAMSNGQGLPVVPYGGGWRCSHSFVGVPITEKFVVPSVPEDKILNNIDTIIDYHKIDMLSSINPINATEENYFQSTSVMYKLVASSENQDIEVFFNKLKELPGAHHHPSPYSGSEYVIVDGKVYRKADHWGDAATCFWPIAGDKSIMTSDYTWKIGVAKLDEFRQFYPKAHKPLEWEQLNGSLEFNKYKLDQISKYLEAAKALPKPTDKYEFYELKRKIESFENAKKEQEIHLSLMESRKKLKDLIENGELTKIMTKEIDIRTISDDDLKKYITKLSKRLDIDKKVMKDKLTRQNIEGEIIHFTKLSDAIKIPAFKAKLDGYLSTIDNLGKAYDNYVNRYTYDLYNEFYIDRKEIKAFFDEEKKRRDLLKKM